MYDIMMNKFKWGGIEDPDVYLNQDNRRMLANFRNSFARLADALVKEGKNDSAKKVMDYCISKISNDKIHYGFTMMRFVNNYFRIGEIERGKKELKILLNNLNQETRYYAGLGKYSPQFTSDIQRNMYIMRRLMDITERYNEQQLNKEISGDFNKLVEQLEKSTQNLN
jgi:hypothetical protein